MLVDNLHYKHYKMKIYELGVIDVKGYETYGKFDQIGLYSSLEIAKNNIPKEEDMTANYGGELRRIPFYDGILCIMELELNNPNHRVWIWSEDNLQHSIFER